MPVLKSTINTKSDAFLQNAAHMQKQVDDLYEKIRKIKQGGGEIAAQRHLARGKLLPRDRIDVLLDDGSPFLEIGQMAAWDMYDVDIPAAGVIAGIGVVSGIHCMIVANDATVKGGTYYPMTVKSTFGLRKSQKKTTCRVFIWWTLGGLICLIKMKSFPIKCILAEFSSTKLTCPPKTYRKLPW